MALSLYTLFNINLGRLYLLDKYYNGTIILELFSQPIDKKEEEASTNMSTFTE